MADDPILRKLKEGKPKRTAPKGRAMRGPSQRPIMVRGGRAQKPAMPKQGSGIGIRPTSAFWMGRALMRDQDREESLLSGSLARQLTETGRANEFGRISQQYDQAINAIDELLKEEVAP